MSRKQRINDELTALLNPKLLIIEDESMNHNVPQGAETHFKVIAVSSFFENLNRISRHRMINKSLANELQTGLHALSLHCFTEEEWAKKNNLTPTTPACRGGKKHDPGNLFWR